MKPASIMVIALAMVTFVGVGAGCGGSGSGSFSSFSKASTSLTLQLQQLVPASLGPGAIVEVTSPQGTYRQAFGYANAVTKAGMTPDMRFRIGGITKTFVSTLLLRLIQENKLGIQVTDPVSSYLSVPAAVGPITLDQLARMVSGLPMYETSASYISAHAANPDRSWNPQELMNDAFAEPLTTPGTNYFYSNVNYVTLGSAMAARAGEPVQSMVSSEFLTPLGLAHTFWPSGQTFLTPFSNGYETVPSQGVLDVTDYDPSDQSYAGALTSTADDLSTWVKLLGNGSLVSPALQTQRLTNTYSATPGNTSSTVYDTFGVQFNNGWLGHNGRIDGYTSAAFYNPTLNATIVVMVNDSDYVVDSANVNHLKTDQLLTLVSTAFFPGNVIPPSTGTTE